jgi:hypothetical protein
MAQAETSNITRRALALGGVGAAVGAIVPAAAATSSLVMLFAEHEQMLAAFENWSDGEVDEKNAAMWAVSDRIMASPVTSLADLALKARTINSRWQISDEFISALQDYLDRFFADVVALAA